MKITITADWDADPPDFPTAPFGIEERLTPLGLYNIKVESAT